MTLTFHLKIIGALLLLLASAHLFFPQRFGWKEDFAKVSLLNRQIFYVHCFFIILILAMIGVLTLFYTSLLLRRDELTKIILAALVLFWAARLFIQLFIYDRQLWRGHRFNTAMHILFTGMWSYYVAVFATALVAQF